jgi:hypothetical protein
VLHSKKSAGTWRQVRRWCSASLCSMECRPG